MTIAAASPKVVRSRRWPLAAAVVPGLALALVADVRAVSLAAALAVVVGVLQQGLP
jgi:capsular polysaccharide biosynthesis protein